MLSREWVQRCRCSLQENRDAEEECVEGQVIRRDKEAEQEIRKEMGTVVEDTGTGEVVTSLSHIQANGANDRDTRSRATVV